ncbi:efflux RND transporter periplasmic adaptor subunit [Heliorestis acidaminivorans]|uniref:efflux RND transporter periplasmic adaptor subunit n=1 Tax=Heliorestis acidaminivorans TaxID=553427 RepID=UPI001FA99DC7|nr:efflux RND transporter periplasmic adaptor subunit [Heliorestis acidaminivorans]
MKSLNKWGFLFLLLSTLLLLSACGNKEDTLESRATVVEVFTVEETLQESSREFSSTLQPIEEVAVAFEVPGRIVDLAVKEGERVFAGQVLARLDSTDYSLDLTAAAAQRRQQEANLEQIETGATEYELNQSAAMLAKAKANYEKSQADYERFEMLLENGAISLNEYENSRLRFLSAKKDYEIAEQSHQNMVTGARREVREMNQAMLEQTIAREERARSALDKTQLRAPFTGTVINRLTSEGQLVNAGTPVYNIGAIDELKVVIPVPDREIQQWQVGEKVTLNLYGQQREGTVRYIYPATDRAAGTIGVEVWVANGEHNWFAGQVVKVSKKLEAYEAIWVPVSAVVRRGDEPYVFILEDNRAVKRVVTIGDLINDHFAITSGLNRGEQVIITAVDRLFDGDEVTPLGQAGDVE